MSTDDAIRKYAYALARLSDPFADRGRVLESLGLDETTWRKLDASWRAALRQHRVAGQHGLAEAFKAAFAAERARIRAERHHTPKRLMHAASKPRDVNDIDSTSTVNVILEPALPFRRGTRAAPAPCVAEMATTASTSAADDLDSTALLDGIPILMALPFAERKS